MEKDNMTVELKAHFLRLYHMALTDGDFHPVEWKMLYFFAEKRGVPKKLLDELLLNPIGKIEIPKDLNTRVEYLYDLALMILADNTVEADEHNTLIKYIKKFEFLEENAAELSNYLLECAKQYKSLEEVLSVVNNN